MPEGIRVDRSRDLPRPAEEAELQALRQQNAQLLSELENAYAQLTAVMQVSQDETRIAYSELQEKLVVLEKKLFEVDLMADVGHALASETHLERLRKAIVDKICLAVPVDLAALHLDDDLREGTHRERDLVFATWVQGDLLTRIEQIIELVRDRPQPLIVADLDQQLRYATLRLRPDARSAAAVPLRTTRFLGVLVLNSRLTANFRQDQEPLLSVFATQASIALQHAQRFRRLEAILVHILRGQGLPLEILDQVESAPVDENRLDAIHQRVRRLCTEG